MIGEETQTGGLDLLAESNDSASGLSRGSILEMFPEMTKDLQLRARRGCPVCCGSERRTLEKPQGTDHHASPP